MIKKYCDKCGKLIKKDETWDGNLTRQYPSSIGMQIHEFQLCKKCAHDVLNYIFGDE